LVPQSAWKRVALPTAAIQAALEACAGKRVASSMRVLKMALAGNISQLPITAELADGGALLPPVLTPASGAVGVAAGPPPPPPPPHAANAAAARMQRGTSRNGFIGRLESWPILVRRRWRPP
jgi:hypothetical protein